MRTEDLEDIHQHMLAQINEGGGRMDLLLHCDSVLNDHPSRKPNPGMAFKAKELFPSIDFTRSIMVGNTGSDMEFGRNIGAYTIYIHTREDKIPRPETVDAQFDNLLHLAKYLQSYNNEV